MAKDRHLNTGEYKPEKYWDARAEAAGDASYESVCVLGASDVENLTAHRVQERAITRAVRGLHLSGKRVLEYGCGIGRWIPLFRRLGAKWHGVDISGEMLSIARQRGGEVELSKIVDSNIPHESATMDLVYSVTVIQHNPHEAQDKILREIARVLKEGGHLLLLEDLRGGEDFNMFPRSADSWIDLAQRHGLSLIRQEGISYWILRRAAAKALRMVGQHSSEKTSAKSERQGLFWRAVSRLDMTVDPYIYHLMPARFDTTAIFLFRKTAEVSK